MKADQVFPVQGELIFELHFGQVEFGANHPSSISRAFESLLRGPVSKASTPFK
jgi:hypothetical protein